MTKRKNKKQFVDNKIQDTSECPYIPWLGGFTGYGFINAKPIDTAKLFHTIPIKPLDIVRVRSHIKCIVPDITMTSDVLNIKYTTELIDEHQYNVGIVNEVSVSTGEVSVIWIGGATLRTAWWSHEELEVVDNLPNLLAKGLTVSNKENKDIVDMFYPKSNNQ